MKKPNLPPGAKAETEAEALQALKDSGMWPPVPPETCYAVLEFASIVEGAANWEEAEAKAIKQFLAYLAGNRTDCDLSMSLVAKEHFDEIMLQNYPDECDDPLEGDCLWLMRPDNLPESPAALVAAVAAMEAEASAIDPIENYPQFDAERLSALSGLTVLEARFHPKLIRGKKRIKRIGDGSHDMSYAEILWLLHRSVISDKLGDHVIFEGWTIADSDTDVPAFDIFMGARP